MRKIFFLLLIFSFQLIFCSYVYSADYSTTFNAEYFMKDDGSSNVNLTIKIVQLNPNVYVKEFSIGFPSSFGIDSVSAKDALGSIEPIIEKSDEKIKLNLLLNSPNTGKMTENYLNITYTQKNLFKVHGNSWEVVLPTIAGDENSKHNIQVILPNNSYKKISIAKPKPTRIVGNIIYWENIQTRTVYAVFGESEYYKTNLTYHLKNERMRRVYYDIAFPPDMPYQKVYVLSIKPPPEKITIDEDGNYLGRYTLNINEKKEVVFNGVVEVTAKNREQPTLLDRNRIEKQKSYLLTPHSYWDIGDKINDKDIQKIDEIEEIYKFTTKTLRYNYNRISKNMTRIGAEKILFQPDQAVCMEFTDLFIALARQNGIYARELNGYGYSDDDRFRPQLLNTDILHSWPQYFDKERMIWVSLDPTWENTSGIDYFTSLDLNHITFVIHGKNESYPISAGMYKTEDTKDVLVQAISSPPKAIAEITNKTNIPSQIYDSKETTYKFLISNTGNIFIYDYPISVSSRNITVKLNKEKIDVLAPLQEEEVLVTLLPNKSSKPYVSEIVFSSGDTVMFRQKITILSSVMRTLTFVVGLGIGIVFFLILLFVVSKKNPHDYQM